MECDYTTWQEWMVPTMKQCNGRHEICEDKSFDKESYIRHILGDSLAEHVVVSNYGLAANDNLGYGQRVNGDSDEGPGLLDPSIWNPSFRDFSEASSETRRGIQRILKMNMTTPQRTAERAATQHPK